MSRKKASNEIGGGMGSPKAVNRRRFNQWLAASSIAGASGPVFGKQTGDNKHVAVIGAGIVGSSIAYHLSKLGVRVTLIERETVASGASHGTFAWINATWAKQPRHYHAFSQHGVSSWHRLQKDLDLPIVWGGSLEWFASESRQARLASDITEQQAWGEPARLLTGAEAQAREPAVNFQGATQVASSPRDGAIDPVLVSKALVAAAIQQGAQVLERCEVLDVDDSSDDKGKLLRTSCGPIEADRVVLATGPDPAAVQRFAGFDLPQRSTPGVIVVTRPVKPLLRGILVAPGIHIHQRMDGRLVIGEQEGAPDNAAHAERLADRPKRFPDDSVADQHAQRLLATTRDYLPSIGEAEVDEVMIGWRPLPVDGHPVIGPSPTDDHVYVAIMHSGVSLAAITGDLVARELADGVEMALLQPFRADRVFDTKNRY
jgi:glycine/D-amino acid oxidase-like deaminating enzyme